MIARIHKWKLRFVAECLLGSAIPSQSKLCGRPAPGRHNHHLRLADHKANFIPLSLDLLWIPHETRPWLGLREMVCIRSGERMSTVIDVWHGVATDCLKFHPGPPCPTLLCPAPFKTALQPFLGWPTRRARSLRPSSTLLDTPRRTPMSTVCIWD
jgi:hypothetical protein